jgi:hypothetical protein
LIDQYRDLWGEYHGYQSLNSDQKDIVDDKTENVDKEDEDTEDKDDVEEDEDVKFKADEDESFVPEDEPDDDDEGDDDDDDAVCDQEENPDDVGEDKAGEGVKEINFKKLNAFKTKWVHTYKDLVSFYNTNGNCHIPHQFVTGEGYWLVNWVHDQRKKLKHGKLTDDRINLLADLQFEFSTHPNVVGAKLTVPVAIYKIFKYKKENRNISIPNKETNNHTNSYIVGLLAQRICQRKLFKKGMGIQTLQYQI